MKYTFVLIACAALAGCDITLGSDGPVITQSDSILSRVAPMGQRSPTPQAAAPAAAAAQPDAVVVADAAPAEAEQSRVGTGVPIFVSGAPAVRALPLGVTRNHVEQFKEAVADAGCTISTREQRDAIRAQTGFLDERLDSIRDYLWRDGDLDRNSGNYVLTAGRCADA